MAPGAQHGLGARIVRICTEELRFALAGVCPARPSDFADQLDAWLNAGKHASMTWLAENRETRADPTKLMPGARSIVLVADAYARRGDDDHAAPEMPQRPGRIARYARGEDYHRVIKKRLHALCDRLREERPDHEFRAFTDTAPILEREHAARAGLGWVAKHTLLIHPDYGSYLLLGGVLTTLDIDPPVEQTPVADHCGTCTRCIDACPTDAITPYSVDASRCISELTIERRAPIPEEFHEPIGDWLFGCDICQEVCPHNSPRAGGFPAPDVLEAYKPRRRAFDVIETLRWTEEDRREAFRTSAMKRAKLHMIHRNARIVARNLLRKTDDPELRAALEEG